MRSGGRRDVSRAATAAGIAVAVSCLALSAAGCSGPAAPGSRTTGSPVSSGRVSTGPVSTGPVSTGKPIPAASASARGPMPSGGPLATAKAVPAAGPVVALGDSYTAGDLLPLNLTAVPLGCARSTSAYPVLVARALGAPLTDASCGSAGVKEMTRPQPTHLGTNPAQLTKLAVNDRVVMFTLGGDDMGFWSTLDTCMALSFTSPLGSPCERHFTSDGNDQLAAKVTAEAPKVSAVLTAIGARAPRARILVVGYPDLFPQSGGCWPTVPITSGDIGYLRGVELRMNAMLAAVARAAGATYVDTYTPTIGHDFCTDEHTRYVEGLVPGTPTTPFHPNAKGQAAMAAAVLAAIRS